MLTVNEIFHSIQGESTRAGRPCVFVRLTACDLRCSWCDTPYAFHEGRKMSVDEVVRSVDGYGCPLVEITGGEPLLQEDVYPLMDGLLARGHTVMLETGGHSVDRPGAGAVIKIVDVKCPGSGEADKNDWGNLDRARAARRSEVRHRTIAPTTSSRATSIARHWLAARARRCCSRPCTACSIRELLSEWVLADRLPVRAAAAGAQVHLGARRRAASDRCRQWPVVLLLSGGLDSYTAAAIVKARGVRPVRADHRLRAAARARDRGGASGGAGARCRAASRVAARSARRSAGRR